MRQFICSLLGIAAAVGIYWGLADVLGRETVSWMCVVVAAPFAVAGFFSYNSMTLEKFIVAWFRSEFLCAGPRKFVAENHYYKMLCEVQADKQKQRRRKKKKKKTGKQCLPKSGTPQKRKGRL